LHIDLEVIFKRS